MLLIPSVLTRANFIVGLIDPILSPTTLGIQTTFLNQIMKEQALKLTQKPINVDLVTKLYRNMDTNGYLRHFLSKRLILAKIKIMMVLKSV
jgi:hypothetical protein